MVLLSDFRTSLKSMYQRPCLPRSIELFFASSTTVLTSLTPEAVALISLKIAELFSAINFAKVVLPHLFIDKDKTVKNIYE